MQLDLLQCGIVPEGRFVAPQKAKSGASRHASPPHPATPQNPADDDHKHEDKAPGAFKTISEAADSLGVPQHVLRFWEGHFAQIKPLKMRGGRRYYRPEDMEILSTIKHLLYKQGYTIKGAKKAFGAHSRVSAQPRATVQPQTITPPAAATRHLSDRRRSQLAMLRQELIGLRETLVPFV